MSYFLEDNHVEMFIHNKMAEIIVYLNKLGIEVDDDTDEFFREILDNVAEQSARYVNYLYDEGD